MRVGATLCAALVFTAIAAGAKSDGKGDVKLELRGRVTARSHRVRMMTVTLSSVDSPFTVSTFTDPGGEFRFHSLPAGTYTVSVLRRSLGAVRRTVVVSPTLADRKGTVRVVIPYSAPEAAVEGSGVTVSKQKLSVPGKAWRKYEEAQRRLAKRDVEAARRTLEEALKIYPRFTAAWNSLGVIAYQTGDLSKAEEFFRKALESDSNAFEPTVNLGGVLLSEGQYTEALAYNKKAVAARPGDALANAQLGIAYFELGDFDLAEPPLILAKHADPSHFSRPQMFLADIYLRRGDRRAAIRELRECVALHPDDPGSERLRNQIQQIMQMPDGAPSEP